MWFAFIEVFELQFFFGEGKLLFLMILGGALVGIGVILEHCFQLRRHRVYDESIRRKLLEKLEYEPERAPSSILEQMPRPMLRVFRLARNRLRSDNGSSVPRPESDVEQVIEDITPHFYLLQPLAFLQVVLGLVGTMFGGSRLIHQLYFSANPDYFTVGAGLREGILTTMLGLSGAATLILAETVIRRRLKRFKTSLEAFYEDIVQAYQLREIKPPKNYRSHEAQTAPSKQAGDTADEKKIKAD